MLRGGSPHPALIELALEVLHEDLEVNRGYHRTAPAPVSCPVTVLHWSADVEVTAAQLDGWKQYSASTDFIVLQGGHYEFLAAPDALVKTLVS